MALLLFQKKDNYSSALFVGIKSDMGVLISFMIIFILILWQCSGVF